jgi:hypothetical protein
MTSFAEMAFPTTLSSTAWRGPREAVPVLRRQCFRQHCVLAVGLQSGERNPRAAPLQQARELGTRGEQLRYNKLMDSGRVAVENVFGLVVKE